MVEWLKDNALAIVTAVVAAYGAVLSTVAILQNRRKSQRRLVIGLSHGLLTFGPRLSDDHILISVANDGVLPVTVRSIGIRLPDGKTAIIPPDQGEFRAPYELAPGQGGNFWVSTNEFLASLKEKGYRGQVRIRGVVGDAVGTQFISKPMCLTILR